MFWNLDIVVCNTTLQLYTRIWPGMKNFFCYCPGHLNGKNSTLITEKCITVWSRINNITMNECLHIMNKTLYLGQKSSNSYRSMYGNQRTSPCSNNWFYWGVFLQLKPHIKPLINEVFSLFSFAKWIHTSVYLMANRDANFVYNCNLCNEYVSFLQVLIRSCIAIAPDSCSQYSETNAVKPIKFENMKACMKE